MPDKKISILEVIPYRSEKITTLREGELNILTYPRFRNRFVQKYVAPRILPKSLSSLFTIRLEEHGSAVWDLIDGKRTVSEIIELLADHFKNDDQYEVRIITYIFQLSKDGLIGYQASME